MLLNEFKFLYHSNLHRTYIESLTRPIPYFSSINKVEEDSVKETADSVAV